MYYRKLTDSYKKTITIDWFEMWGEMSDSRLHQEMKKLNQEQWAFDLVNDYHVHFDGFGTSTFHNSFKLYKKSKLIGAIYSLPKIKSISIKGSVVGFKLSNDILYSDNWYEFVTDFIQTSGFVFNNLTRLDIALDGANHILEFLTKFVSGTIYENKAHPICMGVKSSLFPQKLNLDTGMFQGFQIGSRKSDKHLIIYDKSKEIELSGKKYIEMFWEANGIPTDVPVIRVEVCLRSKKLGNYKLDNLKDLTDVNHIVSLFQREVSGFLDFRIRTDNTKVTRFPPIPEMV